MEGVGSRPERPLRELRRRRRADRPVFAGTYRRAVIVGTDKAVFSLGDEPAELYDLAADPGERHDLAAERPGELARLHELFERRRAADARLRERLAATGFPGAATLQPEERERLRALGYLD